MSSRRATQYHTQRRSQDSVECRYCHENGHVIRRCPTLAAKEERRRSKARSYREAVFAPDADGFAKPKRTFRNRSNNQKRFNSSSTHLTRFAALSVEEEKPEPKKKIVAVPKVVKPTALKGSWARPLQINQDTEKQAPKPAVLLPKLVLPKRKKARWADVADEESDDEFEDDLFLGSY